MKGASLLVIAAILVSVVAVGSALWATRDSTPKATTAESSPAPVGGALRACSKRVIEDWYPDGRVGRLYPVACYTAAINTIPMDVSFAREGIQRALDFARQGKLTAASPSFVAQRAAQQAATRLYRGWDAALKRGVREEPKRVFPNPPFALLHERLRDAARKYDFQIERIYVRWPRQQAPYIVVRTSDPPKFARELRLFIRKLDPKQSNDNDRTGWAYEGFYLQALDNATGQPFLIVSHHWRGNHPGGSQWASDPKLLPFDHA
jgi:hypothetical protein